MIADDMSLSRALADAVRRNRELQLVTQSLSGNRKAFDELIRRYQRQAVAVARAAAFGSRVVIMDEPTSVLTPGVSAALPRASYTTPRFNHSAEGLEDAYPLSHLQAGMLCGEFSFLDGRPRSASAYAHTDVVASRLSGERLRESRPAV